MASNSLVPFYQIGQRIAFQIQFGDVMEHIIGKVIETDTGWIAVAAEDTHEIAWYNLDHIARITIKTGSES